jgi:CDP-glucose 4,6-dehydratase
MRYYITGHTGFKGAWLTQILVAQGHVVSGQSLDPVDGSLFELAGLSELLEHDHRIDIRDAAATQAALTRAKPDAVIHMAAQPLVRASYEEPQETYSTNVMGTLNVLDAIARADSVRASLIITTDKVYRNVNQLAGYKEVDPLGGDDPYSASKAMADILTQSWVKSFDSPPTAIARAGNVIGGGDVSRDRLIPDLIKAFTSNTSALIRYPDAIRPWQHVLDCLNGYQLLVDQLLSGGGPGAWNFGPAETSVISVAEVADLAAQAWGDGASWSSDNSEHPHEVNLLILNSDKARAELNWRDHLSVSEAVAWTVLWEKARTEGLPAREICRRQIEEFLNHA